MKSVVVIGGGASGQMAALAAAESVNVRITIIEKNLVLGRKLAATGNGRCNLTNINVSAEHFHGENPFFVKNVLSRFDQNDTETFFNRLGIIFHSEPDGRVFPSTNMAETVVSALEREITDRGIEVLLNTHVVGIKVVNHKFEICLSNNEVELADKLIISTGGQSYPQLGSTGEGYGFAQSLGHTIIPPRPALVPIELEDTRLSKLQGIKVVAELTVKCGNKVIVQDTDELLFTHYGISGPLTMNLSRQIGEHCAKDDFSLHVNFFPEYDKEKLATLFKTFWETKPQREIATALSGYLPQRVSKVLMEMFGLDKKTVGKLTAAEKSMLIDNLLWLPLKIKQLRSFAEAQVTVGGVNTDELNPKTMESRIVPGLYFCGEVVDIDGDCGGYNLQWAWSSGYLAGKSSVI